MATPNSRELTPYRSSRHFYGAEMRRHRTSAGLSLEDLTTQIPYSRTYLHRVETADSPPPPELSGMLDKAFGTDGHFGRLYELIRQSQEIHPEQYRRSMAIEARARVIEVYGGEIIPGLVQTAAYARALIRVSNPRASAEKIEQMVQARLSRQERLRSETPPQLSVVLSEAALRRPVGGPAAMREQLADLVDVVETPTTVIQVLPFGHGEHGLLGGTLHLMTLDRRTLVAWDEGIATGTLMQDPERVNVCRNKYDLLRSHALPPRETAAFIRSVMEEFST